MKIHYAGKDNDDFSSFILVAICKFLTLPFHMLCLNECFLIDIWALHFSFVVCLYIYFLHKLQSILFTLELLGFYILKFENLNFTMVKWHIYILSNQLYKTLFYWKLKTKEKLYFTILNYILYYILHCKLSVWIIQNMQAIAAFFTYIRVYRCLEARL